MTVLEIQRALKARGYDPGQLDGAWGANTRKAVRAFQADHGLVVDGIVGRNTLAKLKKTGAADPAPVSSAKPPIPWYAEAERRIGQHEGRDFDDLSEFMDDTGIGDIRVEAWCGAFVEACIARTLPDEPLPNNPLGAQNWKRVGKSVKPQVGAILVFWRDSPTSWKGHVGFYAGEDATHFHVLGGNQSNAVSIAKVPKRRLIDARWPSTAAFLETGSGKAVAGVKAEGSEA